MQTYPLPTTQYFEATPQTKIAYALIAPEPTEPKRAPVVLIVGWTGVKEDWGSLPSALSSLGHAVLVFDHRGVGESSAHHPEDGRYTLELLADDCAALTRAVFPQEKVHLMGISMGGMIAQVCAARHASLFHTLILGCTTLSVAAPINPPVVTVVEMPAKMPETPAERRELVVRLLGANYTPAWVAANTAEFQARVDESMRWKRPVEAMLLQSGAIGRFDGLASSKLIAHLPTLIVHGTLDGVIPVSQAHVLADHLPTADLVLLPEIGHLFWCQAEKATKVAIGAFLGKHEEALQRKREAEKSTGGTSTSSSVAAKL